MTRTKQEKPPKRLLQIQLELELYDALDLIREDLLRRDVADTAHMLLKWAAWAHSRGRNPFQEMMKGEKRGFCDWNIRIRAKREVRELKNLLKLEGEKS